MSPYHFSRLFRSLFRETPHEHLTRVRLYEAKRLLRISDMPLGDVGLAVGFQQTSSFSKLFRQRYGISPTEYRNRQRA